jgi:hypothetical protein
MDLTLAAGAIANLCDEPAVLPVVWVLSAMAPGPRLSRNLAGRSAEHPDHGGASARGDTRYVVAGRCLGTSRRESLAPIAAAADPAQRPHLAV